MQRYLLAHEKGKVWSNWFSLIRIQAVKSKDLELLTSFQHLPKAVFPKNSEAECAVKQQIGCINQEELHFNSKPQVFLY